MTAITRRVNASSAKASRVKSVLDEAIESTSRKVQHFDIKSTFFTADDIQIPYTRSTGRVKTIAKWGQLKLGLELLQTIVTFWDPAEAPDLTVVYAGAATGQNIGLMARMFPMITWHLYDTGNFDMKALTLDNVIIYRKYFTDETMEEWRIKVLDGMKIFFISDIRTVGVEHIKKMTNEMYEQKIREEMDMQQEWVEVINPYRASLKLRLPYYNQEVPSSRTMEYLAGIIIKQSFAGPTSSETRLIPMRNEEGNYHRVVYDNSDYENKMYYYNVVLREHGRYFNPITKGEDYDDDGEMVGKFEDAHLIYVLDNYLTFCGEPIGNSNPKERYSRVLALSRFIRDTLASYTTKGAKGELSLKVLRDRSNTPREEDDNEDDD